jgi:putative addiction module antidote
MQTKLRRVGSSLGAILPKEAIDRLGLKEDDTLQIMVMADGIKLSPYNPDFAKFLQAAEETTTEYRDALKVLAE